MRAFGRDVAHHVLGRALEALQTSAQDEDWALGCNVGWDDRVSPSRETALLAHFSNPASTAPAPEHARALGNALRTYYVREVRDRRGDPSFRDLVANCDNKAYPSVMGEEALDDDLPLARVLDVSGLGTVLATSTGHVDGLDFGAPVDRDSVTDWFDEHLNPSPDGFPAVPADADRLARYVIRALNYCKDLWPWHPSWVTHWTEFADFLGESPARWLEVVGLDKGEGWVMVLQYRAREAEWLFRPTQLDAGRNYLHFPTPGGALATLAGHPMDLARAPSLSPTTRHRLLTEYIHPQLAVDLDAPRHYVPGTLRRVHSPSTPDLGVCRSRHWDLLKDRYTHAPHDQRAWFVACPGP